MPAYGLLEYARDAGNTSYEQHPFCEVDAALWSQVVYLPLEPAFEQSERPTLAEAMHALRDLQDKPYEVFLRRRLELSRLMATLPRYAEVVLSRFVDEVSVADEMQFSAVTATLPNGSVVVCFRGTDTSLVGWKEDFYLSFECPVPAQEQALRYAQEAAERTAAPLYLLGHSKGGNLAVYAGAHLPYDLQKRVACVYTFDGPGLMDETTRSEGYERISGRISSLLPQGTLVGLLLNRHKPAQVVKSRALGLFQHDLFSWDVLEGASRFVYMDELSKVSQALEENLVQWLSGLTRQERQVFSDSIFEVLTAADDQSLVDFIRPRRQRLSRMIEAARGVPPEVKSGLTQAMGELISSTFTTFARDALHALTDWLPFVGDDEEVEKKEKPAKPVPGDEGQTP